jgi:uncharacterized repeat protein (TIGR01451 family)
MLQTGLALTLALMLTLHLLAGTAAAQSSGTVCAWGLNDYGQLGIGNYNNSTLPVPISGLSGIIALAAGSVHSLALKSDGTVWAWGENSFGQLGIGGYSVSRNTPVQVSGLSGIVAIAAGAAHSLALKSDGSVWAWGSNYVSQLGLAHPAPNSVDTPVQVPGLSGAVAIASGYDHGLAVTSDGSVWAWGNNPTGNLGTGSTVGFVRPPARVQSLSQVISVAAGDGQSLALKSDGTVWLWGSSFMGGGKVPVQISGLSSVVGVASGDRHVLAWTTNGIVWAWGLNHFGQLGNGTLSDSSTPVAPWVFPPVVSVAGGGSHTLAVRSTGDTWAWGNNESGQLGYATPGSSAIFPEQVVSVRGAIKVAAGWRHSLAITKFASVSPTTHNFGFVLLGTSSGKSITITNNSSDSVELNSFSLGGHHPGDFQVTGPAVPVTIPVNSSITLNVTFTPAAEGARAATLTLDLPGCQPPVTLHGAGYAPPAPSADLLVNQSVVQSGQRLTYSIIVNNNGPSPADNVMLLDRMPAQTQFVSVTGTVCEPPSGGAITCNLGSLKKNVPRTITLVVDVTASTPPVQMMNGVAVSSTTVDPNTRNNASTLAIIWSPSR